MAEIGTLVGGRYRLIELLGVGGFGRVWEATDEQLGRAVAVKEVMLSLLPPAQHAERLDRAQREGRNAAALADHANIVTVYDVVIEDGAPWIVMQLVRGTSLRTALLSDHADPESPGAPLEVDAVARIAEAMLSALGFAHKAGIVHRDVKPANILLSDDGQILLTDFGIAKAETDTTMTVSGSVMGSMAYMAPERAEGQNDGPAADLFSLGATLFEAVEGVSPFEKKNSRTGTLTAILTKPLPPMTRAGRLAPLISALTLKLPEQRPTVAQAQALLAGGQPDGWTAPSPDLVATEAVPAHAKADPGKKPKMPWESVTLGASSGLPRPPVIDKPQPQPPTSPATSTSSSSGWGSIIGGLLFLVVLVLHQPIWNYVHDHFTSATPYDIKNIKQGQCFHAMPPGADKNGPWAPMTCGTAPPAGEAVWQVLRRFDDPTATCTTDTVPGWGGSDERWQPSDKSYTLCAGLVNDPTASATPSS
ncbi:serine/threonine protein kinase [Catenulispora sp. NL8]|uniref:non-specific serine/threonine protein kinase n=1 Tax=Catenulispora pinistramenti TaxID=2705254 RepID=A0ABS5KHN5_9ACTN|nr:serine/threonine-protein kinase [Catenulispora pinistramenti]MBS2545844.1 serine/threonine protein kinase [Catenulispora pinistramenti]